MNNRGDFASIVFVVILIFVVGFIFFVVSDLNQKIYTEIGSALNDSDLGGNESATALQKVQRSDFYVWDYAFLGIFLGSLIAIGLTAYAVRISPIFYWIYGIMSLTVLVLGTMLSNIWQSASADPEFAASLVRFPITNAILGSYYPMIVVAIIALAMILIFGKPSRTEEGFI